MSAATLWFMATTGRELRVERLTNDVTLVAIAARMGISRQALWALERAAIVKADRAEQYRQALADVIKASQDAA